ncbi:MAG: hypothetical protein PVJ89_06590 [Planctomycetota bacterium]|jgi:Zn-dependent protease
MEPEFVLAAGFYVVFVLSTVLHEAAHAWAALKLGDDTAFLGGQVSLDPVPHLRREPVGMVLMPLATLALIGWPLGFASAPYDPVWAARHPRRAGWMAAAGPAANLALLLLATAGLRWGLAGGLFQLPESLGVYSIVETAGTPVGRSFAIFLSLLFTQNLLLLLFNLLPVAPLDGSAALALVLPRRTFGAYSRLMTQPGMPLIGLVLAWTVFDDLFIPAFRWMVGVVHGGLG